MFSGQMDFNSFVSFQDVDLVKVEWRSQEVFLGRCGDSMMPKNTFEEVVPKYIENCMKCGLLMISRFKDKISGKETICAT